MDCDSPRSVALLSVQPKYATQVLNGTKGVEFRRKRFKLDVDWIVVYASSPVRKITGYFSVREIVEGTPAEIWELYSSVGGIDEADYHAYFEGSSKAFAIVVQKAVRLRNALELDRVLTAGTVPQSYKYLSEQEFATLLKCSLAS